MNWWRSLSFIHEARFTGLFSLLWSAKTQLKVCDTSISMSFYKINEDTFMKIREMLKCAALNLPKICGPGEGAGVWPWAGGVGVIVLCGGGKPPGPGGPLLPCIGEGVLIT